MSAQFDSQSFSRVDNEADSCTRTLYDTTQLMLSARR